MSTSTTTTPQSSPQTTNKLVRTVLPSQHYTTNMTTSVPRVEDITNAFPTPITKITGEPNYKGLKNLKDQLKANAPDLTILLTTILTSEES